MNLIHEGDSILVAEVNAWPPEGAQFKLDRPDVNYFDAKDFHSDIGYRFEVIYHTDAAWVLQGGVTYNVSDPGSIGSLSGFGAVSYVLPRARIVSLRLGMGDQAYQAVRGDDFRVDVTSRATNGLNE